MLVRAVFATLCLAVAGSLLALPALAQDADETIAATFSVQNIAITVSPTSVNYGTLQFGASKSSANLTPPVSFQVTNSGNVNVMIKAYGAEASVGSNIWNLSAGAVNCPGTPLNTFGHSYTPTGGTESFLSPATNGSIVAGSVAPAAQVSFTTKLYMPCPGSSGIGQNASTAITVFAVAS